MLGMAAGQFFVGPISDRYGRRIPLLVGLVAYALTSVLCAMAPTIWILTSARFARGSRAAPGSSSPGRW
ncbi:MFS transporter [Nocardia asiatica]|uniref:MFS transporter n=1 Tax=Nocardia asiatica TaxID=209252 RepID=UPI000A06BB21